MLDIGMLDIPMPMVPIPMLMVHTHTLDKISINGMTSLIFITLKSSKTEAVSLFY